MTDTNTTQPTNKRSAKMHSEYDRLTALWSTLADAPSGTAYNGGTIGSGYDCELRLLADEQEVLVYLRDVESDTDYLAVLPFERRDGVSLQDDLDDLAAYHGSHVTDLYFWDSSDD